jgi:hypothetical protein
MIFLTKKILKIFSPMILLLTLFSTQVFATLSPTEKSIKGVAIADGVGHYNYGAFIAWTDQNYNINLTSTSRSKPKVIISEKSYSRPAILYSVGRERVIIALRNTNNFISIIYVSTADNDFGKVLNKTTLNETTYSAPAISTYYTGSGTVMYLAWTGTDSRLNVSVLEEKYIGVGNWKTKNKVVLSELSNYAPALTICGGDAYLAWTGTDAYHHLNVIQSNVIQSKDGKNWGNKVTLDETSIDGPAISSTERPTQKLTIGWTGTDNDNLLNTMSSSDGINFSNKKTYYHNTSSTNHKYETSSYYAPALANVCQISGDSHTYMAWLEKNSFIKCIDLDKFIIN